MESARVFISYSHESDSHRRRVAELAQQLRAEGVEAWIDQFVEDDPPYWPTWMLDQIERADFVLCVVTRTYRERFEANRQMSRGRGVNWEGLVITEESYADMPSAHRKFIAVTFDAADLEYVPRALLPAGRTTYVLPDAYAQLYRRLTGQRREPPPIGDIRSLPDLSPDQVENLRVHSRPSFVATRFLNRERETRRLRDAVDLGGSGCLVVSGRSGIGKSALIGRLLEFLESQGPRSPLEFSYLPGNGSVSLSPDLVRAHLGEQQDVTESGAAATRQRILVIDQIEQQLDDDCDWRSDELGSFLRNLACQPQFLLILVSRHQLSPLALRNTRRTDIVLRHGLPAAEARQMLLEADADGSLGLHDSRATVDQFVRKADGNPRALELVIASLTEDPLLEPDDLASKLSTVSDIATQLLVDSYKNLSKDELRLISVLSVANSAVPVSILRIIMRNSESFENLIRRLALKQLVKVDRVGRRVMVDAFDADYALKHIVGSKARSFIHIEIATAASQIVDCGTLHGSESDTWAIGAVEHLLAASRQGQAAETLDRFQLFTLEPRGVYDQLIRLRRQLLNHPEEPLSNRVRLLRLLYLTGSGGEAHALISDSDSLFDASTTGGIAAAWNAEVAHVLGDADEPKEAMRRFRRAVRGSCTRKVAARALTGAAQLARRRGHLLISRSWLEQSLTLSEETSAPDPTDLQIKALTLHQLAMTARFRGQERDAATLLARAREISESSEDRGGIAYRLCLHAALYSDRFQMDDARATLQRALTIYDEIGDRWGIAAAALALAAIEVDSGDYVEGAANLATATTQADATGNTRVRGLAPGVRLTLERRRGKVRPETRMLALHAADFLENSGFAFYGARVRLQVQLHDLISTDVRPTESLTDPVLTILALVRPLGSSVPVSGTVPAGVAADLAHVGQL